MNARKTLSIAGLIAPPLYIGTIIVVGAIRDDYNFVNQLISQLTKPGAPYQAVLTASFSAYNAFSILFALRMGLLVNDMARFRSLGLTGAVLAALIGVAGIVRVAFFPMDPLGSPPDLHGILHTTLAGVGSGFAVATLLLFGSWFKRADPGNWFGRYSTICGWLLLLGIIATGVGVTAQTPWMGVAEKMSVVTYVQWMFVFAFQLFSFDSV